MTALWVTFRHRAARLVRPSGGRDRCALVGYNRAYLGLATGRYSEFEPALFATPWQDGLLGTLASPSRGCLFSLHGRSLPFAYLPFAFFQLRLRTLLPWLLVTLVAHALLISKFSIWWAGWCFGPRYWTEVIPLLAISLGLALSGHAASGRSMR